MTDVARHIILPGHELARCEVRRHETVNSFLRRTGWEFKLPTICVVNGEPVLRKDWKKKRLKASDNVAFISKPWGGGGGRGGSGKQVLGLVAVIALAAFAPWAGGLAAGALGLTAGTLGFSIASNLIAAGIIFGGSLLINALVSPKPGGQNDSSFRTGDPIYSISASGNTGKPLQPIPVGYGTLKTFPDFATAPWSEFSGNDQYLNVLLCLGCGKYQVEKLYIDDTELWDSTTGLSSSFSDVTYAFYDPGEDVTLFPANVTQSIEVSGQQLIDPAGDPNNGWIGGFVTNASGSVATDLIVDLVFPNGVWYYDDINKFQTGSAPVEAEYRPVDAAGAPTGSYTSLFSQTFSYNTHTPQRVSIKTSVTPGRYEVRVRRTNAPGTSGSGSSAQNDVVWAGLRAYVQGPSNFTDVSTVAIRIRANEQLSAASSKRFGVKWTRILPVWNGAAWVDTATQNPYWAFYDAATNTTYGAARPTSKIDFQAIVDAATAADTRGDKFNYLFNQIATIPAAFDTILKSNRARHRWSGDVLTIVRDEWQSVPDMLLTDREIVRGSLSIDWLFNTEDSADSVLAEYLDEDTWKPAEVQYPSGGTNPARIRLDGVTNRDQAFREAAFTYLQAQYRRTVVTLDTEHDGRRLGFGSPVRVQSELPQTWGQSGTVVSRSSLNLTLDRDLDWSEAGQHYIGIRDKRGRLFGPVKCSQGASASIATLDATDLATVEGAGQTLDQALVRADGADDPSFSMGVSSTWSLPCVVISGRPNGDRVTLTMFVDDSSVHTDSLGTTPTVPSAPDLSDPRKPSISGLTAKFRQGIAEPIVDASWWASAGATSYLGEISYDGGVSWLSVYSGTKTNFSVRADVSDLRVRVAAIGEQQGAWSSVDLTKPTISIDQTSLSTDVQTTLNTVNDATIGNAALDAAISATNTNITSLTSTVNGNTSSITTLQSSVNGATATVTITIASPGVVTWNSHGFTAGRRVKFTTTGALPTGITAGTYYFVLSTGLTTNTFRIASTPTGTAINTSGSQSGTHTGTAEALTLTVAAEALSRAQSDDTINTTVTSLTSTVNSNTSAITTEQTTRANADTALSNRADVLEASVNGATATVTITIASPGVVTWTSHGLAAGRRIKFTTTGALPTGITAGTYYYVLSPTTNTFQLASTPTGTAINTSGTQSGTHTGTVEAISAAMAAESVARATQDDSITTTVTSLTSTVNSNTSAITTESTTRASADTALSNRATALESSVNGSTATVTITIASPGVVTWTSHGLSAGRRVKFTTTGALPTGIVSGTFYFVLASGLTTNTFQIASTPTGTAINTSGSQSGTHTGTVESVGATVSYESLTRATNDDSLSTSITSLTSTVNSNTSAITTESTTRANADTALSNRATALESSVNGATATVTITIASPGVVTWTSHGLAAGRRVKFTTTGALPTGIVSGTYYYVLASGLTTNTFQISSTPTGSAINTTGSQSGTHTGTVQDIGATVSNEALTRATNDDSITASVTSLTSTVNSNTAAISSEATTRATADTALSGRADSLEANVNGAPASHAVTVTIASPAVFTWTSHGLVAGRAVKFTTTGALPTGLTAGQTYYVIAAGLTTNTFEVSATFGGSAVNTSGSQSGTHTVTAVNLVAGLDNVSANQTLKAVVSAGSSGALSVVDWQLTASVNGTFATAGLQMAAYADAGGTAYSRIRVTATQFEVQIPNVTGGDPVAPFAVQTVNGASAVALQSSMYADGGIPARAFPTGALGKITYSTPSDISDTWQNWWNSGNGKQVAALTTVAQSGSILKIEFDCLGRMDGDVTTDPSTYFGDNYYMTLALLINGVSAKTWQKAICCRSGSNEFWINPVTMSFRHFYSVASTGQVTVQVKMTTYNAAGGTLRLYDVQNILLTTQEMQSGQIVDGASSVTPSVSATALLTCSGNVSSHTWSAVSIGAADPFRNVVVGFSYANTYNSAFTVTIGGIAARFIGYQTYGGVFCALYTARVPTGTTADIVVSINGSTYSVQAQVWRVIAFNESPVLYKSNVTTGLTSLSVSLTTQVGQVMTAVAAADQTFSGVAGAWGGTDTPTEEHDAASTDPYAALRIGSYDMTLTQATTQNFTMTGSYTGPGNLAFIAALWQ